MPEGATFMTLPKPQDCSPAFMMSTFDVGMAGCVRVANRAIPLLLAKPESPHRGSFLISGATMSLRGGEKFGALAPAKAALRSFSQSMYNAYAKEGIHVGHVVIDGAINSPGTNQWESMIGQMHSPKELSEAYLSLHQQPPSVWSQEIMLSTPKTTLGMRL